MRIQKLFRQHSRTLLMVFMALLLVTFLIPSTVQGCGERGRTINVKRGEVYGKSISMMTLNDTREELRRMASVGLPVPSSEDAALDYYLMVREAERLGVRVGRDEVKTMLQASPNSEALLQHLQDVSRRSYDEIYEMIGRMASVRRLADIQGFGLFTSLPREELAYRDSKQRADAQVSQIDARAFVHLVPEPTPEELQAFFDAGKDRVTAHTDTELVFGYKLPDRVQIEYLTVDPKKVETKVQVKNSQVKQFYEDRAQFYRKPDPAASQPAPGQQPPMIPMTPDEARELARKDLRESRAIEMAQSRVNDMYTEAHRPWASATKEADGFLTPPEKMVSFEELKERFSTDVEVEYGKTELADNMSLRATGLSRAVLGEGALRLTAIDYAFRVQGILAKEPDDKKPVLSLLEPAQVVLVPGRDPRTGQSRSGQAYLFRVLRVAPSAPPASLDDVREQVIKDWKLTKAYELARAQAEKLAAAARESGLTAAIEQATELKSILTAGEQATSQPATPNVPSPQYAKGLEPITPPDLTRAAPSVRGVGSVPGLPKALFALADAGPTDTGPAHRVVNVPYARAFKWIVSELVEVKPVYVGSFEQQLADAAQKTEDNELSRFAAEWRAPEALHLRTGFKSEPWPPTQR